MKINHIHHIAVNTLDIEESIEFYQKMLDFKMESRVDMGICTLVYMKICEGSYFELFDLYGKCEKGHVAEDLQGIRHIALDVCDIETWNKTLKEKGAEFVMELCDMHQINKKGLMIKDPNGLSLNSARISNKIFASL